MKDKKVAIYLRVSTQDQNTDLQKTDLVAFIKTKGWSNYEIYEDKATGTNGNRVSLKRMLTDSRDGKINVILCWKLDRLFRSLKDLINTLQELSDLEVEFVALKDNIDMTTNTGRLMTHILGAFAEFEASIIKARVNAGLAEAKRRGVILGRRKTRPSKLIQELRSKGYAYRRIAELADCSISTVCEELKGEAFGNPDKTIIEQKSRKA